MKNLVKAASLLILALVLQGSGCPEDDGAGLQDSPPGGGSGPQGLLDNPGSDDDRPADSGQDPADPDSELPSTHSTATGNGSLAAGQACSDTSACGVGLACEAGFCVNAGEMRIALVWTGQTDLDLHVRTPTGEEIYYRNRNSDDGGEFQKDGCIADRCDGENGPFSEAVLWVGLPTQGTYEFWAVNYDGVASANATFEIRHDGHFETYSATVGGSAGAQSSIYTYTVDGEDSGPGELRITSHTHEQWVRGPGVTFRVDTGSEDISTVSYTADGNFTLGQSTAADDFPLTYSFNNLGEHQIKASGFDNSGMELDNHEITLVVMDRNDGLPNPRNGAVVSERLLAKRIQHHAGSIDLYNVQVSGRNDGADSRSNINASANNQLARQSCYGNAPCGRTRLDARMLQAMVILRQVYGYSFRVTSIAGGSHSRRSRHYRGVAFDVDIINGRSVRGNTTLARQFMRACRDLGATEVLGPGNRGHSGHVHCAW